MANQKRIITPEHFRVAPDVLGLALASPGRRAFAMAIDLLLVAVLVKSGGAFLGLAAAILLFRASGSHQPGSFIKQSVRTTLRIVGAILLFIVILNVWDTIRDRARNLTTDDDDAPAAAPADSESAELNLNIAPRDLPQLAGALFAMRKARDSTQTDNAATQILETARRSGATSADLFEARSDLIGLMGDDPDSIRIRAVDAAIQRIAGDSLTPSDEDAPEVVIARLRTDVERLDERNDQLRKELEDARKAHGVRSFIAGAADDLGVGFGWSAIYFTAFLALWRGLTPGKRLAHVRVLRLDGKPMGWWLSFERFGGYAASFSVGLLGFAQILWDRNRQGLHDKACETVVVNDSAQAKLRA